MRALPVERLYLKSGDKIELSYPKAQNFGTGGLVVSGVQRTPDGDVGRVIPVTDIAKRVTLGLDEEGNIVEDETYPLPSER